MLAQLEIFEVYYRKVENLDSMYNDNYLFEIINIQLYLKCEVHFLTDNGNKAFVKKLSTQTVIFCSKIMCL